MPRGKYVNHKGRSRHFTSPEELEEERKKAWKKNRDKPADEEESESSEEEEEEDDEEGGAARASDSEEEDSDDGKKAKGVQGLIEIENPNRVQKKAVVKVTQNTSLPKPELSRREREELEKQQAAARYQKLHSEGKTAEARADLARLAIIKQNRADAAAKREQEKKEREEKAKK